MNAAEKKIVAAIAAARDESLDDAIAYFSEDGEPAVVGDRLVRIRTFSAPKKLDLRGLDAIVHVRIDQTEKLEQLTLGQHPKLRFLGLDGNRLKELDVGGCPALEELRLQENRLEDVRGLPATLKLLDVGENPKLRALDLRKLTALEELLASSSGLSSLDLSKQKRLRVLAAMGTKIAAFDLRGLPALANVMIHQTGATVVPPDSKVLTALRASSCRIDAIDPTKWPDLLVLSVAGCGLRSLSLANPKLEVLDVSGNPIEKIDLRGAPRLREATLPDSAAITCTERQSKTIAGLRARLGLPKAPASIAKMDAFQLHQFVDHYNWDDGVKKLSDVIRHPACDLATALTVYWLSEPAEYAEHRTAKAAPKSEQAMVALLREIEAKVAKGGFATASLPFDVRDVGGTDLSSKDKRIPKAMSRKITVAKGRTIEIPAKR